MIPGRVRDTSGSSFPSYCSFGLIPISESKISPSDIEANWHLTLVKSEGKKKGKKKTSSHRWQSQLSAELDIWIRASMTQRPQTIRTLPPPWLGSQSCNTAKNH